MKEKSNRRKFIRNIGIGSIATGIVPSTLFANKNEKQNAVANTDDKKDSAQKHQYNQTYSGDYLNRIAFPFGGMGAGMFCIEGTGAISNMSVRNKPDVFNEPQFFAGFQLKELQTEQKL